MLGCMETGGAAPSRRMFVGRDAELAFLSRAIERVRSAQPEIVWIEGEPGIGKTAFTRRFLSGIEGVIVLEVSGEESETNLDYRGGGAAARARQPGDAVGGPAASNQRPVTTQPIFDWSRTARRVWFASC
jgi:AAA ATPase domain